MFQKLIKIKVGIITLLIFTLSICGSVYMSSCTSKVLETSPYVSDLLTDSLANRWDEAIPLGNAHVGALVWKKHSSLRFSLDRADLWDLRPMDSISGPDNRFSWVKEQIKNGTYENVQKKFDWPYELVPAPSKIPGGALEFPLDMVGNPESVRLFIKDALCEIRWPGNVVMKTFVQSDAPMGWFVVENAPEDFVPSLVAPSYNVSDRNDDNDHSGASLERLGYEQGKVEKRDNGLHYHQKGYDGFHYDIDVEWKRNGNDLIGAWSVTSSLTDDNAHDVVISAMKRGVFNDYKRHKEFWRNYWDRSVVNLPDSILQRQYDNEMYKFGSASRSDSYPISLQAIWTADNDRLPPWKGDYHHDLNTQLSYWPAYTGNHLEEGLGYLNTLWNQRDRYKTYTRQYFETEGMNVPGVCTLLGDPMGGWIQYAMSQTAGAWLAYHFYLNWKYSDDLIFLRDRAYPFIKEVAVFMEQNTFVDETGVRRLEYSSSPEIFDNSVNAWFTEMTNYDQALIHSLFRIASEAADSLDLRDESAHWATLYSQLGDFDIDEDGALTFAKGFPYKGSHRHFSHAMAIYPLGLLDVGNGERDKKIIEATIKKLDDFGPDYWTGYSYAWLGNLKARVFDGDGAAKALKIFAECFCSPNTFHLNGDQSGTGKSRFTYRPFTLEGNFAFASGIQEMLLQSHAGEISVFPALPEDWKNVSFAGLLARGGVEVSAEMKNGQLGKVTLKSKKSQSVRVRLPGDGIKIINLPADKEVVF